MSNLPPLVAVDPKLRPVISALYDAVHALEVRPTVAPTAPALSGPGFINAVRAEVSRQVPQAVPSAGAIQQMAVANSDTIVRAVLEGSNLERPIMMEHSVVFRAGTSTTNVAIGAGGILGMKDGVLTFGLSANDGSFFFGPANNLHKQLIFSPSTNVFQIGKDIMLTNSTGSLLSVSTVLSDVASASASASSALSGLSAKLDNNAATVMSSNFYLKTSGFDAGNGVAIYGSGIVAKKNNVNTFVLNASGDAVFAGDISAATGTFAGNISSAGFISVTGGSLTSASGVQGTFHTALLATANVAGAAGVVGQCATGLAGGFGVVGLASSLGGSHGVYGEATGNNSTGVYGATNHAGSRGVTAVNTAAGGVALHVQGRMTIDNTTLVSNLNADLLDGQDRKSVV